MTSIRNKSMNFSCSLMSYRIKKHNTTNTRWFYCIKTDDAFSIGTGLERVGFARPVRRLWMSGSSAKTRNRKRSTGARPLPFRCLSQFFPVEKKINCLENEILCVCLRTFHLWGNPVFIMDDHDNFSNWMVTLNSMFPSRVMTPNNMFPCWRVIQYFSHGIGDFLSLW